MSNSELAVNNKANERQEAFHDVAYEYIKDQILNMTLKPGQQLSELEISRELGISRTPVRDALRQLTAEGLITWIPGKGRMVYTLSLHDIGEIFAIKIELESLVAREAALKRAESDIEALDALLVSMEAAAGKGNVDDWLTADRLFHRTLFDITGNERIRQIINNLNEQWHRLRVGLVAMQGRMGLSAGEHREVVEAIRSGDADRAALAMREHLEQLESTLVNVIKTFVVPYVGENL